MTRPEMIVSGGQTGADKAGLIAARDLGIKTGGTAPKGYRIQLPDGRDSSDSTLVLLGLKEHASREYPPRTRQNVKDSDGTAWFGYEYSPGGKLTMNTCNRMGKPYICNPTPEQLREWVQRNNIKILNVAGNRTSDQNPDIFERTYAVVFEAFKEV